MFKERNEIIGRDKVHIAAQEGRVKALEFLYCKGYSLNTKQKNGDTLLHISCNEGQELVIEWIIEKNKQIKEYQNEIKTYLNHNNKENKEKKKEIININAKNRDGETALHLACSCGYLSIVQLLVDNDSDIYQYDEFGYLPIHRAVIWDHIDITNFLLRYMPIDSSLDKSGNTLFHLAAYSGSEDTLNFLLYNFGNSSRVLMKNSSGLNSLEIYSTKECKKLIKKFLQSKSTFTYTPATKISQEEYNRKTRLREEERMASEENAWKVLETELKFLAFERIPRRKREVFDDNENNKHSNIIKEKIKEDLINNIRNIDEEFQQRNHHQRQRSYSDTETNITSQLILNKSTDDYNRRKKGRRKSIKRLKQRKKDIGPEGKTQTKLNLENESPLLQKKISFSKGPTYDHITSRLFQPTTSFLQHVYRGRELQHSISLSNENCLFKVQHTTPSYTGEISKTTEPLSKDLNDNIKVNLYPSTHSSGGTKGRKVRRKSRESEQSRSISRESCSSYNSISTDYLSDSSCLWTDSETASVSSLPITLPTYQQSQENLIEKIRPHVIQNLLRYSSSSTPNNSDSDNNSVNLKIG